MSDTPVYTPMMQQFLDVKQQYPYAILLYRMGDFYETFFEDAEVAARELEITLTSREGGPHGRIPMAGVPHHALEAYLPKLIAKGYKVAICEQMEAPKPGKLVRREVVRVITPGTLLENTLLAEKRNNYLAAVTRVKGGFGLAFVDISTGEFRVTQLAGEEAADLLSRELAGLEAAEILVPSKETWGQSTITGTEWEGIISDQRTVTWQNELLFDPKSARERLLQHFNVRSLESFGCQDLPLALGAAGAILHYLAQTQMRALKQIQALSTYQISQVMVLDKTTRRNLELLQTYRDSTFEGSLLWVLDQTCTAMGGRLLRDWLNHPLLHKDAIEERLEAVEELQQQTHLRFDVRELLDSVRDMERLAARVATQTANPRDLKALAESVLLLPRLSDSLAETQSTLFASLREIPAAVLADARLVQSQLLDSPSITVKDGNIFKTGVNAQLDELRGLLSGGKSWLQELEQAERERSGINSLKVGYSKTFGYFIEITHTHRDKVPADYMRKQTLTNAERYITPALKEKEAAILNADEQSKLLEHELFAALRAQVGEQVAHLQGLARAVAQLDALGSLAEVAVRNRYVRPQLHENTVLYIAGGRHPVIEKTLGNGQYVPNDTYLDTERQQLMILTGPNMSGKSSYMRQIGLLVLMAQIGSFVPADQAEIGLCDRIFTRVGAVDDIATGQSTFMVEMAETSHILHHASSRSLILLDEIGRGTSTFDGVSIAWAVSEYLAQAIKARTVFATHYHELNRLSETIPGICNFQVSVQETQDGVVFLHKVIPGGADRSYGIEVARLAGLPASVLSRAQQLLADIEKRSRIQSGLLKKKKELPDDQPDVVQLSLFGE